MSKNWGRTPVTNADKRHLTQVSYLVETADGTEDRIDRRPLGKVERFVDPSGGVMSLQLYSDGDPKRLDSEMRRRAELHRKGFVEYAKCPLRHGTRNANEATGREFAKMPQDLAIECKHDPKVMTRRDGELYAGESCPHIEWLITFRRNKATEAYEKRNSLVVKKERAEQKRRELDALELAKRQRELEALPDDPGPERRRRAPKETVE